ncbi:MAG: DUF3109 family protein, partial [Prevotella sp.]|nr:DUF3109 family protein [Prevotella sp.]
MKQLPSILQVEDVLISADILTERFCCDLNVCKGECCIEGDAGAPVTLDEIAAIEDSLDVVWPDMSASAQSVVDRQGVSYIDQEGDLVTSIVYGKDCVFTCYDTIDVGDGPIHHCCLCAFEKAFRAGRISFCKPISCALYPIREKKLGMNLIGLNYNRWDVCKCAREKGVQLDIPVYRFLKEPLIRRFGERWYGQLETLVSELHEQG